MKTVTVVVAVINNEDLNQVRDCLASIDAGPVKWVMKYNPNHAFDDSDYYGASLKSFEILLSKKGYKLVGCNLYGVNAFFVREDLMKNHFLDNCTAENHYEPGRLFLRGWMLPLHVENFGPFEIK